MENRRPIDFRGEIYPNYIGRNTYRINDPIADTIYNNSEYDEQETTNQLNRPILWQTDEEGFVTLRFPFIVESKEKYLPEQLSNLLALYGAVYTFYDQDLTEEILMQILNVEGREYILNRFRGRESPGFAGNGEIRKYRDFYKNSTFVRLIKSHYGKGSYELYFQEIDTN